MQLNRITLGLTNQVQGASANACTNIKISLCNLNAKKIIRLMSPKGTQKWGGLPGWMKSGGLQVAIRRAGLPPNQGIFPEHLGTPESKHFCISRNFFSLIWYLRIRQWDVMASRAEFWKHTPKLNLVYLFTCFLKIQSPTSFARVDVKQLLAISKKIKRTLKG